MNFIDEEILNLVPGHLYWFDENGIILGCNLACAQFFGYPDIESILGKSAYDIIALHGDAKTIQQFGEYNKRIMAGETVVYEEVTELGGEEIIFSSKKCPLRDKGGRIYGVVGNSIDITAERRVREKIAAEKKVVADNLRTVESYMRNILDANLPVVLYWVDTEGVFLGCNLAQARVFGKKTIEECVGKTTWELIRDLGWNKDLADQVDRNNRFVMATGKTLVKEEFVWNGPDKITHLSHKTPLRDSAGRIVGVLGFSVDISERKHMEEEILSAKEEAERANEVKTEFLLNMSHDFNTPLNGIVCAAQFLNAQKSSFNHDQQILIETLDVSTRRLMGLVESILDFQRVKSGKFEIHREEVDLVEMISRCVDNTASLCHEKGLEMKVDYPESVPKSIVSDLHSLTRILINLLGNAVRFTEKGQVILRLRAHENDEQFYLTFMIEDTGRGIPAHKLDSIFERFNKLTPSATENEKGYGLGLAIVKQFVAALGGKVWVASTLGVGSTFTVEIPYEKVD